MYNLYPYKVIRAKNKTFNKFQMEVQVQMEQQLTLYKVRTLILYLRAINFNTKIPIIIKQ